jgi:hypothetical protein
MNKIEVLETAFHEVNWYTNTSGEGYQETLEMVWRDFSEFVGATKGEWEYIFNVIYMARLVGAKKEYRA